MVSIRDPTLRLMLALCLPGRCPVSVTDDVDWERLVRLAYAHDLAGVVAASCEALDMPLPRTQRLSLAAARLTTGVRNTALLEATRDVLTVAHDQGLPLAPLKGAALILGPPFLAADTRQMRDIDLLVDARRLPEATALFERLGYRIRGHHQSFRRHSHHLLFERKVGGWDLLLELHWTAHFGHERNPGLDRAVLARATTNKARGFPLLDAEDTLLGLLLHLASHRFAGGLKWALDTALAGHHLEGRLRWPTFWSRARAVDAVGAVGHGLDLVDACFAWPGAGLQHERPKRWNRQLLRRLAPLSALVAGDPGCTATRKLALDVAIYDHIGRGGRAARFKLGELWERRTGRSAPRFLSHNEA